MLISNLLIAFVTGVISSFGHCLGMCGGFALHLARGERPAQAVGRQMIAQGRGGRIVNISSISAEVRLKCK